MARPSPVLDVLPLPQGPEALLDCLAAELPGVVERVASSLGPVFVLLLLPEVESSPGSAAARVFLRSITIAAGPDDESIEIEALERGADIYLGETEPPRVTEARLAALLRARWAANRRQPNSGVPTRLGLATNYTLQAAGDLRSLYSVPAVPARQVRGIGRWLARQGRRAFRLHRRQPDYLARFQTGASSDET